MIFTAKSFHDSRNTLVKQASATEVSCSLPQTIYGKYSKRTMSQPLIEYSVVEIETSTVLPPLSEAQPAILSFPNTSHSIDQTRPISECKLVSSETDPLSSTTSAFKYPLPSIATSSSVENMVMFYLFCK